jgi:FkbM family methyltransferase
MKRFNLFSKLHNPKVTNEEIYTAVLEKVTSSRLLKPRKGLTFDTNPSWTLDNIHNGVTHDSSYKDFLEIVGNESSIIDIGANSGYSFSTFYNFGHRGSYFAVEPLPQHAAALEAIKNQFPKFDFASTAISNLCGDIEICVPSLDLTTNSSLSFVEMDMNRIPFLLRNLIGERISEKDLKRLDFNWFKVRVQSVDCMFTNTKVLSSFNPTAIKIDTEGLEALVLEGATEVISKFTPALLIEGANRNESVRKFLKKHEYMYVRVNSMREIEILDLDQFYDEVNGMFLHKNKDLAAKGI